MRKLLILLLTSILISCDKEDSIDIATLKNYIIMDPFESNNSIPDTVYYSFDENNVLTKILLDYSLINEKIQLEQKYTNEEVYTFESNHIYMLLRDSQSDQRSFGKNLNEWEVIKFNSDTLIVNWYFNGTNRVKVGRIGFSVLEKSSGSQVGL